MRRTTTCLRCGGLLLALCSILLLPLAGSTEEPPAPAYEAGSLKWLAFPVGGIGYDIRVDPRYPEVWYVTDVNAGFSRSDDHGLSWEAANNGMDDTGTFCATVDPHLPDTIWAGTFQSGRIYRSDNQGTTWVPSDVGIAKEGRSIRGITVDPNSHLVLYAAVEVNGDGCEGTRAEVYRSTDRGGTWTTILGLEHEINQNLARYVWVDSRDGDHLFVGTGFFDRASCDTENSPVRTENEPLGGSGILETRDGGVTWARRDPAREAGTVSTGSFIPSLDMHPTNPDVLLAAVMTGSDDGDGVYSTADGGATWQRRLMTRRNDSIHAVEIVDDAPNVWYAAGFDRFWYSMDSGTTWSGPHTMWAGRQAMTPVDIQAEPGEPNRVLVNSYGGGNMVSLDWGETWSDASEGYSGALVRRISVHPDDWRRIVPFSLDGGESNAPPPMDTDGMYLPSGPTVWFRSGPGPWHAVTAGDEQAWRSVDGGQTWVAHPFTPGFEQLAHDLEVSSTGVLYTGFNTDACGKEDAAWLGACAAPASLGGPPDGKTEVPGIQRSVDGGKTWTQLPTAGVAGVEGDFGKWPLFDIGIDPHDPDHLLVANVRGLFESSDAGLTWARSASATSAVPPLDLRTTNPSTVPVFTSVVFDPNVAGVVYAANRLVPVLRSVDGGSSWTALRKGIPQDDVIIQLVHDPVRSGVLYAASLLHGVYFTANGGRDWSLIPGLPKADPAFSKGTGAIGLGISSDGSVLYVGSQSTGVYRLGPVGHGP